MWNLKPQNSKKQRIDFWFPEAELGAGEQGEGGQKVYDGSYKVSKDRGVRCRMETVVHMAEWCT